MSAGLPWNNPDANVQRVSAFTGGVAALDGVPNAPPHPTFHFNFTHFRPSPFWPTQLNAFPILDYRGEPAPPEGTSRSPFVIAINENQDIDTQILAATDYVVSILRRQTGVLEVQEGERPIESLVDSASEMDAISRSESIALARAMRAGQGREARLALSRWGFGVSAKYVASWLDREAFVARVPFFARCYNSLPIIREAVDRIVSATIGQGGRVSGPSEEVRILVEQGSQDARMTSILAHAVRDSLLMGAGALALDIRYGLPRPRLIRPERLVLDADTLDVAELDEQGVPFAVDALLLPGQIQPGSRYPSSILEAWGYSLHVVVGLRDSIATSEAILPPEEGRSPAARRVAENTELMRRIANEMEQGVAEHLRQVTSDFDLAASPLYLRGRELWT